MSVFRCVFFLYNPVCDIPPALLFHHYVLLLLFLYLSRNYSSYPTLHALELPLPSLIFYNTARIKF